MQVTTCTASTCGQNAQCQVIGGRPVCSCYRGYSGDPLSVCTRQVICSCFFKPTWGMRPKKFVVVNDSCQLAFSRSECLSDGECRGHLTCRNGRCIDPCSGTCGINADCQTRNHVPVCNCPPGYTGNPFSSCRRFDPCKCHRL